jgi:CubicO group peptidase (beta-lactamase class C family)
MALAIDEKPSMPHEAAADGRAVHGTVSPGFEAVREAFAGNFATRRELGGACCVYHRGKKVVDLWGGIRNAHTGEPWERDTMALVYSATKGLAAMVMALAHSRGWLDYEERVCRYWPEFAQQGKQRVTVRQLLSHQAGLYALNEPLERALVADLDRLAVVLARQRPAWKPGTRQAYHAITLGFYEGELLRRIDPRHRSLGQFFQDEIASPLGLDVFIRLPETIPNSRLAILSRPRLIEMLRGFGPRFMLEAMNPRSNINKALRGSELPHDESRIYARNLEVPSGGGVGTARAIAHAYGAFAAGGRELGLRAATLDLLAAPAVAPKRGFHDECMKSDGVQFSLGFMKSSFGWPFGDASAYGAPGSGGALGFADPRNGIGYAYVTSQMGTRLTGDPRDVALRDALYSAL